MSEREKLVEVMLTAMSEHHSGNFAEAAFIVDAQLAALEAAGVRLVPVEATEEMVIAGEGRPDAYTRYVYSRMLAASPYAKEKPE